VRLLMTRRTLRQSASCLPPAAVAAVSEHDSAQVHAL
jgi:hypothetical protein